jgi:hypothetical protein
LLFTVRKLKLATVKYCCVENNNHFAHYVELLIKKGKDDIVHNLPLATWSRVDLGQEEEYLALILNLRYSNFFPIRVKLPLPISFYFKFFIWPKFRRPGNIGRARLCAGRRWSGSTEPR